VGPGDRVTVVEDTTTTGGSLLEAVDVLAAEGIPVVQAVILVDRSGGRVAEASPGGASPTGRCSSRPTWGGSVIVRVHRSPLRLLGYALVALPMVLLALDMLFFYRYYPSPEMTQGTRDVQAADGSVTRRASRCTPRPAWRSAAGTSAGGRCCWRGGRPS